MVAVLLGTIRSGNTMVTWVGGTGGNGEILSPRPSANAVPPFRKNGTSEPNRAAAVERVSALEPNPHIRSKARRVAAASLLPPPNPMATGMRFLSRMYALGSTP